MKERDLIHTRPEIFNGSWTNCVCRSTGNWHFTLSNSFSKMALLTTYEKILASCDKSFQIYGFSTTIGFCGYILDQPQQKLRLWPVWFWRWPRPLCGWVHCVVCMVQEQCTSNDLWVVRQRLWINDASNATLLPTHRSVLFFNAYIRPRAVHNPLTTSA